ncbi:HIT-like protein [Biscogniauxia mediterranea]|nr:HIT-like protein [Biscogniauxia mediterranea]
MAANTASDPEDAITHEEIAGTAPAPPASTAGVSQGTKRNAFTELMAPRSKKSSTTTTTTTGEEAPRTLTTSTRSSFAMRDGLGAYIHDPTGHAPGRVIFHGADFVAINDRYPKAAVHALLLPRSRAHGRQHPIDAFEDAAFLAAVRAETARLKRLVAKELQRRYGRLSAQDRRREAVLDGREEEEGEGLPPGRDWEADLRVGVHAHPSMNDLHVHVLSPDMVSDCMRHKKHYLTFNTPFLIDLADFPLAPDDPRRHPGRAGYTDRDLQCWRCGKNFGNKFKQLKEHLAVEFEEWKKE